MRVSSRVSLPRPTRYDLALIGFTMIWGETFFVVRHGRGHPRTALEIA